jgi:hypothetical protein
MEICKGNGGIFWKFQEYFAFSTRNVQNDKLFHKHALKLEITPIPQYLL